MFESKSAQFSIESSKANAAYLLSTEITRMLNSINEQFSDLVILCIGTDRSTGDCLGPLVGHKLKSSYYIKNAFILGTLKEPVHAKNLNDIVEQVYKDSDNPLVIAIDASLGKNENIGKINLFRGPLFPGAGVNKNLKSIGDISITGIVNISGYMEYIVLQNTRLSLVMDMADIISLSLYMSLNKNLFQFNNILSMW